MGGVVCGGRCGTVGGGGVRTASTANGLGRRQRGARQRNRQGCSVHVACGKRCRSRLGVNGLQARRGGNSTLKSRFLVLSTSRRTAASFVSVLRVHSIRVFLSILQSRCRGPRFCARTCFIFFRGFRILRVLARSPTASAAPFPSTRSGCRTIFVVFRSSFSFSAAGPLTCSLVFIRAVVLFRIFLATAVILSRSHR